MIIMKTHVSLKAMAEGKVDGIQKATYFKVDPYKVEFEDGFNLREEGPALDAHLEKIYIAMKAGHYFPPIDVTVIDGRVLARDGHCRTRAARRLVDEGIPYTLEARQFRGNEIDSVLHMLGSDQGKAFAPLEQGRGFLRLLRYGLTIPQIADRLGFHRSTVDNGLLLAESPVMVQMLISSGAVSTQVAIEYLKKYGDKAGEHLQNLIEKAGGTKVTKKHVSGPKVPAKVVQSFVATTSIIRKMMSTEIYDSLMSMADDELEAKTVPVPARLMRELMTAQRHCEPAKEDEL